MFFFGTQSERLEVFNTKTDEVKGTLNNIILPSPFLSIISVFVKYKTKYKLQTKILPYQNYSVSLAARYYKSMCEHKSPSPVVIDDWKPVSTKHISDP